MYHSYTLWPKISKMKRKLYIVRGHFSSPSVKDDGNRQVINWLMYCPRGALCYDRGGCTLLFHGSSFHCMQYQSYICLAQTTDSENNKPCYSMVNPVASTVVVIKHPNNILFQWYSEAPPSSIGSSSDQSDNMVWAEKCSYTPLPQQDTPSPKYSTAAVVVPLSWPYA